MVLNTAIIAAVILTAVVLLLPRFAPTGLAGGHHPPGLHHRQWVSRPGAYSRYLVWLLRAAGHGRLMPRRI